VKFTTGTGTGKGISGKENRGVGRGPEHRNKEFEKWRVDYEEIKESFG
jgi:hypothetical protein